MLSARLCHEVDLDAGALWPTAAAGPLPAPHPSSWGNSDSDTGTNRYMKVKTRKASPRAEEAGGGSSTMPKGEERRQGRSRRAWQGQPRWWSRRRPCQPDVVVSYASGGMLALESSGVLQHGPDGNLTDV